MSIWFDPFVQDHDLRDGTSMDWSMGAWFDPFALVYRESI